MRKEPLVLGVVRRGLERWSIPGLDLIPPFGSCPWGDHVVYTTPSLFAIKEGSNPKYYILSYRVGLRIIERGRREDICLGMLYELMSDSEKEEFDENILEIMEALKL